ncbi:hypothetical protein MIB92_15435 [Aestuariirhabdus sp. Z084]|uniref:hypothetical protein n=1 Tax=Aestuariirhabdus haliotis TaxID=2918751 RepID=UPI00201B364F|nr:hypothetical protein [Aestuariirhabdus haliotis]MCL6417053.1 hypothetical protein [Aestuariirhabdus haliotis]MCL6420964.1 hypothetical protein [Aestuariirhabdus haliotis]
MASRFTAHGNCRFSISGNIVSIYAAGPWNLEFFQSMQKRLRALIESELDIDNYAILIDFVGVSLASPDVLDYHLEFVKQGNAKAIALNLQQCTSSLLTGEAFSRVYTEGGLTNKCFDNREDAIAWLQGFVES